MKWNVSWRWAEALGPQSLHPSRPSVIISNADVIAVREHTRRDTRHLLIHADNTQDQNSFQIWSFSEAFIVLFCLEFYVKKTLHIYILGNFDC